MAGQDKGQQRRPIVVRREEVIEGGHHGGAWKVAYADFVTAMMAFFLLMWLLNATTEAQRKGLADYFTPINAMSHNSSGTGQPFGGHTPFDNGPEISDRGAQAVIDGRTPVAPDPAAPDTPDATAASRAAGDEGGHDGRTEPTSPADRAAGGGQAATATTATIRADFLAHAASGSAPRPNPDATDPERIGDAALRAELARRERAAFERAAQTIRAAVAADPALADLARQLAIDLTPEGLRIQILDADRTPMFATGSATLSDHARDLLAKVAPVLERLPEGISISGHTDAAAYKGGDKTNWELSSERANATRRLLVEAGLGAERFRSITGNADRDPLLPAEPLAAANRRIAIVVLRGVTPEPGTPEGAAQGPAAPKAAEASPVAPLQSPSPSPAEQ